MSFLTLYRYNCIKLLRSPRTWIAMCLMFTVCMGMSQEYYRFCVRQALTANVLESVLISSGHRICAIFHPVNLCFILSESPFMDENAAYMIFRTGRRAWYWQGVLLVVTVCAAYYLLMALSSCVIMFAISYTPDIWSGAARLLADGQHSLGGGTTMSPSIIDAYSPLTATATQLALYCAYTLPIVLLYFVLTISVRRAYAFALPVLLHALMLIIYLDGIYNIYSPFLYLFLGNWLVSEPMFKAYFVGVCAAIALASIVLGARSMRKINVHNLAIMWLK